MVDEEALIKWYVACELTANPDAFWSTYMHKYRNIDKLFFGPLWDFDIAFNNDSRMGDITHQYVREVTSLNKLWINRLWQDPWFRESVGKYWLELVYNKDIENKLLAFIKEISSLIDESQQMNYQK